MTVALGRVRSALVPVVAARLAQAPFLALVGEPGSGKRATVEMALSGRAPIVASGDAEAQGYLAGFHELVERLWEACEEAHPEIVTRHEQALKRLFPRRDSPAFRVPKDLTNTSSKKERTRFYHHEYQGKLLHALHEFVRDALAATGAPVVLVIDDAQALSPTALSFLELVLREAEAYAGALTIVLLCDRPCAPALALGREPLRVEPLSREEALAMLERALPEMPEAEAERLWLRSAGNPAVLGRLVDCRREGLTAGGYFEAQTAFDFLLDRMGPQARREMLAADVAGHCRDDDPLVRRNYETAALAERDALHREAHADALAAFERGEGRLRIVHARALSDPRERLDALCAPGEILKGIGLYDTWLAFFSRWFTDDAARRAGTGDDEAAHAFVNVAFVLYSLGMGSVSIPFLTLFHDCFPKSRLVPTVIYAQSMTYGRYMLPVDLPRANGFAETNLEIIDAHFRDLDTYAYIKIFAENALAYIRARQGRFEEALTLCTNGIERMTEVYGPDRFRLHQSILIYNTAQVYEIVKDFSRAEEFYRKAIAMDPYYGEYYNDLANLLSRLDGREEEALDAYATAIDLCPSYYEAHLNRALLLQRLGRIEEATADCRRVLDIKPAETRASLALGNLLLAAGAAPEACAVLERALRHARGPELYNNLAVARLEASDPTGAREAARVAVSLKPGFADAHNNLAICAYELGDPQAALEHAARAVDLAPADPDYAQTRDFIADALRAAS